MTIDGPFSKDLDDAIWLEDDGDGKIVHVSIADVSAVVQPGTEIDRAAMRSGFTRYYYEGNSPMIPRFLSEDQLSLHQDQRRPTITISVPMDEDLGLGEPIIKKTVLVNEGQFTYEVVDSILEGKGGHMLKDAYQIAKGLFKNRRKKANGLVVFEKGSGIVSTEDGDLKVMRTTSRYNSHLLVQEFNILGNYLMARYFEENGIPGIFRNHEAIKLDKEQRSLMKMMEKAVKAGDFATIERLRKEINGILGRANYDAVVRGHSGLNLDAYMHFTSPIRRYPDLVNERQLSAHLASSELPYCKEELERISVNVNIIESRIKDESNEHYRELRRQKIMDIVKPLFPEDMGVSSRRILMNMRLRSLAPGDFSDMVSIVAKENKLTNEITNHIYTRLDNGQLGAREMFSILFESDEVNYMWKGLRRKVMDWLNDHPHDAEAILEMGTNRLDWHDLEYYTNTEEVGMRDYHTSTGTMVAYGETIYSLPQTAVKSTDARNFASVSLIESLLGYEGVSRYPEPRESYVPLTGNQKTRLNNLCSRMKWPRPKYSTVMDETAEEPTYITYAWLTIDGNLIKSEPWRGPNKKYAEQFAAAHILDQIYEDEDLGVDRPKDI